MVSSENCMAGDFKKSSTTLLDETDLLLASGWLVGAVLSTGVAGGVEAGTSAAGTGATGTTGGVGCCTSCGGHSFSGVGGCATGEEGGTSGRGPVGNDAGSAFLSGDATTDSGAESTGYHEAGEDVGVASPWTSATGFSGSGFPVSGFRTVGCFLRAARFFCGFWKPSASKSASRD